ncbi:hypothetical protein KI387_040762, partial [Taxus chinensis]
RGSAEKPVRRPKLHYVGTIGPEVRGGREKADPVERRRKIWLSVAQDVWDKKTRTGRIGRNEHRQSKSDWDIWAAKARTGRTGRKESSQSETFSGTSGPINTRTGRIGRNDTKGPKSNGTSGTNGREMPEPAEMSPEGPKSL